MADSAEWSVSANDAFTISLVAPSETGLQPVASFHPKFTYQIFGDDETIYGYKDLKIQLRYRVTDMRPHLKISHSHKIGSTGETDAVDVKALLEAGHLPTIALTSLKDFEESSKGQTDGYEPPGELLKTLPAPDGAYEVWKGSLAERPVQQMINRIQILVPLFIEGGTYIGEDASGPGEPRNIPDTDRWTVFFLYHRPQGSKCPTFVGYSTVYRFFYYKGLAERKVPSPDWELPSGKFDLNALPCRSRLSQFLILPPFQRKGNGPRLYNTIFQHYLMEHSQTKELTVEDPNEAFDDLRDVCDLAFLRTLPEFDNLEVNTQVPLPKSGPAPRNLAGDPETLEAIRAKSKIAPRQFYRVLETHLMSKLPRSVRPDLEIAKSRGVATAEDKQKYKVWQLIVKQRLYRHNRDALGQLDPPERKEKLHETLGNVEFEYARLLAMLEAHNKHGGSTSSNGKRKMVDTGDDQEAEPSKRVRMEDSTE